MAHPFCTVLFQGTYYAQCWRKSNSRNNEGGTTIKQPSEKCTTPAQTRLILATQHLLFSLEPQLHCQQCPQNLEVPPLNHDVTAEHVPLNVTPHQVSVVVRMEFRYTMRSQVYLRYPCSRVPIPGNKLHGRK